MVFKICHIVREKYIRVHTTFKNTNDVNHYYLCSDFKPLVKFIKTGEDLINGNKIIVDLSKNVEEQFQKIIDNIKPDIFLIANIPRKQVLDIIHKNKLKVIFINHGIFNNRSGIRFVSSFEKSNIKNQWKQVDGYIVSNIEKKYFEKVNINKKNIHTIMGTPQMDYLLSLDYITLKELFRNNISSVNGNLEENTKNPLPKDRKFILFLQNGDGIAKFGEDKSAYKIAHKEYVLMLESLVKFGKNNNYQIITKIKGSGGKMNMKKMEHFHDDPYITLITSDYKFLMYQFLFCDIVVVETCSTSYLESLILNPKVIQYQLLVHSDYLDVKSKKLLYADNVEQMNNILKKLDTQPETIITNEYQLRRNKYISDYYDKNNISSSEQIINILKKIK